MALFFFPSLNLYEEYVKVALILAKWFKCEYT